MVNTKQPFGKLTAFLGVPIIDILIYFIKKLEAVNEVFRTHKFILEFIKYAQ